MDKQALLEQVYEESFNDELEKISDEVKIPEGGLKPGLLINDLTRLMTDEDAKRVKKNKNVFLRSGPGLIPGALVGAVTGNTLHSLLSKSYKLKRPYGAIAGGALLPLIAMIGSKAGLYDKQALSAAKKMVQDTKKEK